MDYLFVDATGDPGYPGMTPYYGMAILHVPSQHWRSIQRLVTDARYHFSLYGEVKKSPAEQPFRSVTGALKEGASRGLLFATGLYIEKAHYSGRYLKPLDGAPPPSGSYLRNYLLRHLLEMHFTMHGSPRTGIDLVLDRLNISEQQRENLINYLGSRPPIPLREPFNIPRIDHLTDADSWYVDGLQLAHSLAAYVKAVATSQSTEDLEDLCEFVGLACLL